MHIPNLIPPRDIIKFSTDRQRTWPQGVVTVLLGHIFGIAEATDMLKTMVFAPTRWGGPSFARKSRARPRNCL